MNGWRRVLGSACALGVSGVLVVGCSDGGGTNSGTGTTVSSTALPPAPTGFDPCSGVLKPVLDSEQLHGQENADSNGNGGTQWRGCTWVQSDGYSTSIRVTNITLSMIRQNGGFRVAEELTIDGRSAVTYHDSDAVDLRHECLLNVGLTGGSLELSLNNPASNRLTGSVDTCEIAKRLAGKMVPLIPASV
ncbi:DUF3558 domain-containing protein [Nocardia aurantia]|uniref:DUF3558 domain-containing protein n=1 Tax=Nocardia aurantia TaxID=2585199 RepID=UPI001295A4F3|nr:DUF3558 domain-containing protein [Nocardia aurantia]